MLFNAAIAAAVLAFSSVASAAPSAKRSDEISVTSKLLIAENAAARFKLLPDDSEFIFDLNQAPSAPPGNGGELIAANRVTFPALVGSGMGFALGRVNPCGMNTLHVHPRATELQMVTAGRLITEMVPENGVMDPTDDTKRRVIRTELASNMMTVFYQGSMHVQFNPDCHPATFVAAFNNEDFGTGQVADQTFALSDDIIAATFGQSIAGEDIDFVRQSIPKSIALGVEECLATCGIAKRSVPPPESS